MENKGIELCKTCKQPLTIRKYGGKSIFHENHDPILCITNMVRELLDKQRSFADGFVCEILALLDRIEIEDDTSLTSKRFDIAEKHGLTVVFGEPVSGRVN